MMLESGIPQPEPPHDVPASDMNLSFELSASAQQIAFLNSKLPRGFRFESAENWRKLNAQTEKSAKRKKPVSPPYPSCRILETWRVSVWKNRSTC